VNNPEFAKDGLGPPFDAVTQRRHHAIRFERGFGPLRSSRWGDPTAASLPWLAQRAMSEGFCIVRNLSHPTSCLPSHRSDFATRPSLRSRNKRDRYYEGSDSRSPPPSFGSLRLSAYAFPPFRSQPRNPSEGRFVSRLSAFGCSRLRHHPASSPRVHAESDSFSYRLAVRLRLLPTPPLSDAVAFGYMVTTHHRGDLHPADNADTRTHWIPVTSTGMTADAC